MTTANLARTGRIVAVSISGRKGIKKSNQSAGVLKVEHGLEGDAHAGPWHRQVSLLDIDSIDRMRAKGAEVDPGDFAENVTTQGLKLWELPIGTRLKMGSEALVEVTQIGKECHSKCAIFKTVGDCVMPREGIFVRILEGGRIEPGDEIEVLDRIEGQGG